MSIESDLKLLDLIGTMSDDAIAESMSRVIRDFRTNRPDASAEEVKRFVHELRDVGVYIGGMSGVIHVAFNAIVGEGRSYPPPCDGDESRLKHWFDSWSIKPKFQVGDRVRHVTRKPIRVGSVLKDNSPAHIVVMYDGSTTEEPEFPENMETIPPVEQLAEVAGGVDVESWR